MKNLLNKTILGIPLGLMVGLWVEIILLDSIETYRPRTGPLAGALVGAIACWGFRNSELGEFSRRATIGILFGMFAAVLLGAEVYCQLRTSWELSELSVKDPGTYRFVVNSTAQNSSYAQFQYEGLLYGIPLGVFLGGLCSVVVHIWKKPSPGNLASISLEPKA